MPLELAIGERLRLDDGRHVGDAPPIGRGVARRALENMWRDASLEGVAEADALGDRRVAGHVGEQLLDGLVIGPPPALEAWPIHRTGHDPPALRTDLEEDAQLIHHAHRLVSAPVQNAIRQPASS